VSRRDDILLLLRANGMMTRTQIARSLGITKGAVWFWLAELIETGKVQRHGQSMYYKLTEDTDVATPKHLRHKLSP
jgi:predicted ArsR family transcriptional regulator